MKKLSLYSLVLYVLMSMIIVWVSFLYGYKNTYYIQLLIYFSLCSVMCLLAAIFFWYFFWDCSRDCSLDLPDPSPLLKEMTELYKELKTTFLNIALMFLFAILIISFVALCRRITM